MVTEDGLLLYQFQELMVTANKTTPTTADKLEENQQLFSLCSPDQIAVAVSLGLFNFVGLAAIGKKLQTIPALLSEIRQLQFVSALYPVLICYSFLYLTIPMGRFVVTAIRNRNINRRNAIRNEWATFLKSKQGKETVKDKEIAKESLTRTTDKDKNNDNIFYSTKQER
jgi:hypothetical protein